MIPIVTASDWFFLPGLATLLQSLQDNSNLGEGQQIYVIEYEPLTHDDRKKLTKFNFDILFIDLRIFGDYSPLMLDAFQIGLNQKAIMYWRSMLRKILIFKLAIDKIIWLDADTLCLGDLTELEDFPALSATPDWGLKEPMDVLGHKMFNAGLMIIEPSDEDYEGLIGALHEKRSDLSRLGGDQPILNWYFYKNKPDKVHLIDPKWCMLRHLLNSNKELFDKFWPDIRMIHYVSKKPWTYNEDEPCPDEDRMLWDIWMEYFLKARKTIRGET